MQFINKIAVELGNETIIAKKWGIASLLSITTKPRHLEGRGFVVHHSKPKLNHCVRFRIFVLLRAYHI